MRLSHLLFGDDSSNVSETKGIIVNLIAAILSCSDGDLLSCMVRPGTGRR